MGFIDRAREAASANAAPQVPTAGVTPGCPGHHYVTEVNKGSIRMQSWEGHLNDMFSKGYRLEHVFEQDGNTVQVYAHHFHS